MALATPHATQARTGPGMVWLFVSCCAAMLIGALIDTRSIDAEALVALCTSADGFRRWQRMWTWMPATHGLMLLGGIVASIAMQRRCWRDWRRRLCVHAGCLLAMVAGMAVGSRFALATTAALDSGLAGLMIAMGGGMAVGMLLLTAGSGRYTWLFQGEPRRWAARRVNRQRRTSPRRDDSATGIPAAPRDR